MRREKVDGAKFEYPPHLERQEVGDRERNPQSPKEIKMLIPYA